jgi:hypothetical protein
MAGWRELRDDFAAIRDQHTLARSNVPEIFTQSILELPYAHGLHDSQCSHQ